MSVSPSSAGWKKANGEITPNNTFMHWSIYTTYKQHIFTIQCFGTQYSVTGWSRTDSTTVQIFVDWSPDLGSTLAPHWAIQQNFTGLLSEIWSEIKTEDCRSVWFGRIIILTNTWLFKWQLFDLQRFDVYYSDSMFMQSLACTIPSTLLRIYFIYLFIQYSWYPGSKHIQRD